ncbi:chemotaxis protein CheW [Dethiothermospora halolimnae]|uniref:chemotaxis protein CheW n=1 Tax=Dethiothermospora halolimnae TaxID=3114390 RepID=UPI003CCC2B02
MDMNQYLDMFIEESKEHLQHMNDNLLTLENSPKDLNLVNEIFRVAHTLKGMAGTMGFTKIADLTHKMENVLHVIRNGEREVTTDLVDVLFECFDTLEAYTNNIIEQGSEGELDCTHIIEKLSMIEQGKSISEDSSKDDDIIVNESTMSSEKVDNKEDEYNEYVVNVLNKAKEKGLNTLKLKITIEENCMLKSARAFIIFNRLEEYSEIIQSTPPAEDIEDEKFDLSFSLTLVTEKTVSEVREDILSISEIEKVEANEINLENVSVKEEKKEIREEKSAEKKDSKPKKAANKKAKGHKFGKTVRVDIERLDNLMNLVSELIIIKTRMEDIGSSSKRQNMNETIEYLERITSNLHDAVMKVRMVPIERVFNRFPRMVRDLAKELDKKINLQMSGEETEVDRTVIDEIGDPLIHLIRNSIDHGIESPKERKELGKEEAGTVKLIAYPDGNNVVIEVTDNGGGINVEKVKQKAIERGLVSAEEASNLSDEEIVDFLFDAGFSTADKISDVSGRGVGLDVVKTKIQSIGGNVEVETTRGKGSKFIIRLPLTLSIIQALLIKISDEIYALPLGSIKEIIPISSKDIRTVQDQEVVLFRNKTLPIIRLKDILGIEKDGEKDELISVIVKKGDKEAGLIVDDLMGQQEIVMKSLGKYLTGVNHIAGATILGNGSISMILDVNSLF